MLDLSYFQTGNSNVQAFYSNPGGWQTWIKPRGAKSINILCIGAGGGGGSYNAIQQAPGGGAAAGYVRATYQANILPDVLYVQTGIGGAGTTTSPQNGGTGSVSYVSIVPDSTSRANIVCISSATVAGGMSSEHAMRNHYGQIAEYRASEGKVVKVQSKGSVVGTIKEIMGGIRSCCTYLNCEVIEKMPQNAKFVVVNRQLNGMFS